MCTCKKFERCPFSPKNAFKLKKSREDIKYEFYWFYTKILHSKSLLSCYVWGFILCLFFFCFGVFFWLVNGMGSINDNLVTYAQWPFSPWYKDQKVLTEEKTEVVSIIVSGRHASVLCSGDSIYAEVIWDLSRIVHEFEMAGISQIFWV